MSEDYRFIAFSMITQQSLSCGPTASAARDAALRHHDLKGDDAFDAFLEILDCESDGRRVWTGGTSPWSPIPLHAARVLHRTVFRGAGYATNEPTPIPAIAMEPDPAARRQGASPDGIPGRRLRHQRADADPRHRNGGLTTQLRNRFGGRRHPAGTRRS